MRMIAIAALSLVLGVAAAQTVHSQQQPLPLQVGFVDIERVMGEYRKRQSVVQELDARRDQLTQQFKQRRSQIEEKRDRLATLAEGSDDALKLQREVDLESLAWKRDKDYEDERLLREQNQKVGMIYREICGEVRAQAESKGLAAVFAYDPLPAGFEKRMNALAVIQNRDVLWADGRLDITAQVVEALNSQLPAPLPAPSAPSPGGNPAPDRPVPPGGQK
jgi:Skp family chaperone for outer membrane proteins